MKQEKIQEKEEETNVIEFPVKPQPDEGNPDDPCWLKQQGVGALFTCQRKNQAQEFGVYIVAVNSITPKKQMYGLVNVMSEEPWPHPGLVNPIRFCNLFELVEVIRTREEYLVERELNEQRNRANQSERLEGNETTPIVSETDEESQS